MQDFAALVLTLLWLCPFPLFVVFAQSSVSERKQHCSPVVQKTWANINTQMYMDVHTQVCVLRGHKSISVSLKHAPPSGGRYQPIIFYSTHTHSTLDICIRFKCLPSKCVYICIYMCVCVHIEEVCERQAAGRGVLATGFTTWPLWLRDWQLWSRLIALLSQVIGSHPGGSFVRMHCGNDVN